MSKIFSSRSAFLGIAFSLLVAPLPLSAIADNMADALLELKEKVIAENSYVYLDKELHDEINVISQLRNLDGADDSILAELDDQIKNGFCCINYNFFVEALEYAAAVLSENYKKLDSMQAENMICNFDALMYRLEDGSLLFDPTDLAAIVAFKELYGSVPMRDRHLRTWKINKNIDVLGKATFFEHVLTKEGIHIIGHLKVGKSAIFKKNVQIKGTLSAADAIIGSLSVGDLVIASCIDNLCVNNLSVTDLAVTNCMNNLCVNNLSVVDEEISGTLSANNAVIQNLTFNGSLSITDITITGTLSVNDEIVTNITATNLSATDAVIAHLQATDISVVDETVTGILSAADAVITHLQATSMSVVDETVTGVLSAADAVITNLQVTNMSVTDETVTGTLSVNNEVVSNLTVTNCITNLCVNNLSIVNESISGTLSVNNEIVTNLTATNLSATNGVVTNLKATNISVVDETVTGTLSVNDLVLTGCIASLCATDFSAVDASISGTLSVLDEVIDCNLNVGCNIIMVESADAAHGNVFKGATRFIHNFGTDNTFVGELAGNFALTGTDNTAVGRSALTANTAGNSNTAVGSSALVANTAGGNNVAVGRNALLANTTGIQNVAIGFATLTTNTTGIDNTAIGTGALSSAAATASNNTAIGFNALQLASGSNNIGIGANVGSSVNVVDNNILIGAPNPVVAQSNTISIGTGGVQTGCLIQGIYGVDISGSVPVALFIGNGGQLGTITSSAVYKDDIADIDDASAVYSLRPVSFVYKKDAAKAKNFGLIAEEVLQLFPEIVVMDKDGLPLTVRYDVLPVLLLRAIQKQKVTIDQQAITIDVMNAAIISLQKQIDEFNERIKVVEYRA